MCEEVEKNVSRSGEKCDSLFNSLDIPANNIFVSWQIDRYNTVYLIHLFVLIEFTICM